jgi:hypothetical protein
MKKAAELRGYIRGLQAAAAYCGISDRSTFREWCREFEIRPRIIHGQAFFRIATLDRFMDPDSNSEHDEQLFWRGTETAPNEESRSLVQAAG